MRAVLKKALADLRRRRLQAAVVLTVVLLASLAGTTALSLLVESDAPFDHAFTTASGAHLVVRFNTDRVDAAALTATGNLSTIAAVGGPWREVPLQVTTPAGPRDVLDLAGRADPGGPVDRLQLVSGRWARNLGEIVMSQRAGRQFGYAPGDTISPKPDQGVGSLGVVGVAASVFDSADGWVTPGQAMVIHSPLAGASKAPPPADAIAFYRLHGAASRADIDAATRQLTAAVPAGAIVDVNNWLDQKLNADRTVAVMLPFLLAFSAFALLAAAMIIGNVVSGAVIAGYREIGVMKAIGFTPAQVVAVLALQMLVPSTVGAVVGIGAGVVVSQPFLAGSAEAFGLPQGSPFVPWVLALCLVAALGIALVATLLPGLRAGRLSAAEAIARGSAPAGRGTGHLGRLIGRLPAPRAITLGVTDALARPVRSAMTLVAVVIGVATVTFATGLTSSLGLVKHALAHDETVQVNVIRDAGNGPKGALSTEWTDAQVTDLLRAQPGTVRFTSEAGMQVHVSGVGPPVQLYAYRGDASWLGYQPLSGRWFSGAGEVVAPQAMLYAAHKQVGDSITVSSDSGRVTLRIVGSIFDQHGANLLLRSDWSTLAQLSPGAEPVSYEVNVGEVAPATYVRRLEAAIGFAPVGVDTTGGRGIDTAFLLIESVLGGLALVLTVMAMAGVFNTVVLNTREKARDIAILKTLGMTPRQVTTMVLTSVAVIGLAGAVLGIPAGQVLHRQVLTLMGQIAASTAVPEAFYTVFSAVLLGGLAAAGLLVALLGAWLPATWAARSRISAVLGAE